MLPNTSQKQIWQPISVVRSSSTLKTPFKKFQDPLRSLWDPIFSIVFCCRNSEYLPLFCTSKWFEKILIGLWFMPWCPSILSGLSEQSIYFKNSNCRIKWQFPRIYTFRTLTLFPTPTFKSVQNNFSSSKLYGNLQ